MTPWIGAARMQSEVAICISILERYFVRRQLPRSAITRLDVRHSSSSSRSNFWDKAQFRPKTFRDAAKSLAPSYLQQGEVSNVDEAPGGVFMIDNVVHSALPSDIVRLLERAHGLHSSHIHYLIQGLSRNWLLPTGQWLVKLSPDCPADIYDIKTTVETISLSGQRHTLHSQPPKHGGFQKWIEDFIQPEIGDCSGRAIIVPNLSKRVSVEDLFLTFRMFNVAPEQDNQPPSIQLITSDVNNEKVTAIVRFETSDDAQRAIRERQGRELIPRGSRAIASNKVSLRCQLLHNVVVISGNQSQSEIRADFYENK